MATLAVASCLAGYGLSRTRFNLPLVAVYLTALSLIFVLVLAWNKPHTETPILATIHLLKTLTVPPRGSILEPDFGRGIYANLNYTRLSQMECIPFDECLKLKRPTIIVSDDRLRAHYADDKGFQAFIEHPTIDGFNVVHVPNTKVDVYVYR